MQSEDRVALAIFANKGYYCVSSCVDNFEITVRNRVTRCVEYTFQGHEARVSCIVESHSGKYLASSDDNGLVFIRNMETGLLVQTCQCHGSVLCLAFDADDARLFCGGKGCHISVLFVGSDTIDLLYGHTTTVSAISIIDSTTIISADYDGIIRKWTIEEDDGRMVSYSHMSTQGQAIVSMTCSPKFIVVACTDKSIRVFDINWICVFRGHQSAIISVCFNSDFTIVASIDTNDVLCLWDAATLTKITDRLYYERSICFHPSVPACLLTILNDSMSTVDVGSFTPDDEITHRHEIRCLDVGDQYVASGDTSGDIVITNVATMRQDRILTGHIDTVNSVCFSPYPSDYRLVSASDDESILLWEYPNGICRRVFIANAGPVKSCVFLTSLTLMSLHQTNVVKIWDIDSGKCIKSFAVKGFNPKRLFLGPENSQYTVAFETTFSVYSVDGILLSTRRISGHSIAIDSKESSFIATKESDNQLDLIHWNNTEPTLHVKTRHCPQYLARHKTTTAYTSSTEHGAYVSVVDDTSTQSTTFLARGEKWLSAVAFSPNGQFVVSAGDNASLYFFWLDDSDRIAQVPFSGVSNVCPGIEHIQSTVYALPLTYNVVPAASPTLGGCMKSPDLKLLQPKKPTTPILAPVSPLLLDRYTYPKCLTLEPYTVVVKKVEDNISVVLYTHNYDSKESALYSLSSHWYTHVMQTVYNIHSLDNLYDRFGEDVDFTVDPQVMFVEMAKHTGVAVTFHIVPTVAMYQLSDKESFVFTAAVQDDLKGEGYFKVVACEIYSSQSEAIHDIRINWFPVLVKDLFEFDSSCKYGPLTLFDPFEAINELSSLNDVYVTFTLTPTRIGSHSEYYEMLKHQHCSKKRKMSDVIQPTVALTRSTEHAVASIQATEHVVASIQATEHAVASIQATEHAVASIQATEHAVASIQATEHVVASIQPVPHMFIASSSENPITKGYIDIIVSETYPSRDAAIHSIREHWLPIILKDIYGFASIDSLQRQWANRLGLAPASISPLDLSDPIAVIDAVSAWRGYYVNFSLTPVRHSSQSHIDYYEMLLRKHRDAKNLGTAKK